MSKALLEKHVRAIELRKMGWSYAAIKRELGIAKSTASAWLNKYPLSHEQMDKLQFHNEARIEHFRETMARKKKDKFDVAVLEQSVLLGELSIRELYITGLALYWGEGGKTQYATLSFSNTDPRMISFFIRWLCVALNYPVDKIGIKLHLYLDMDINMETEYWSGITGIRTEHFAKPYIKATTLKGLTYKTRGHGTCNIYANGLVYSRPVFAAMEVLSRMFVGQVGLEPTKP